MFDIFGESLAVRFFIAFVVVFGLIGAAAWLVRRFGANRLGGAAARGRQPRLAVIEAGAVDGRRKLVIVRRDNVEHLIMIGGPTDILIEANIVRGQASRDTAQSRGTGTADALARAVPLGDAATAWPLAPEPGAPRQRPAAAAEESVDWHLPVEPTLPVPPPAPAPRRPVRPAADPLAGLARPADPLAGLAHELSKPNGHHEPALAAPRAAPILDIPAVRPAAPMGDIPAAVKPAPAPAPAAAAAETGGDQNLADMAQRLEAALRRPGAPAVKPASPASAPAPALASAPRIDSVNGARDKAAKPEPAAAPDEGGAAFGSLEQEMANLLGRPSGKQ